jgi:hypothetical protein
LWLHLSSQRNRRSTLHPESTPPFRRRHLPLPLMRLPSEERMSWSRRLSALRTKPALPLTRTTRITSLGVPMTTGTATPSAVVTHRTTKRARGGSRHVRFVYSRRFDARLHGGRRWRCVRCECPCLTGGTDHTIRTLTGTTFSVRPLTRVNSFPVIATDRISVNILYAVWAENPSGDDDSDIMFARSTDGGNTWSSPIRVNDDVNAVGDFNSQFFPWMAAFCGVRFVVV